jgi:hypothetical protein
LSVARSTGSDTAKQASPRLRLSLTDGSHAIEYVYCPYVGRACKRPRVRPCAPTATTVSIASRDDAKVNLQSSQPGRPFEANAENPHKEDFSRQTRATRKATGDGLSVPGKFGTGAPPHQARTPDHQRRKGDRSMCPCLLLLPTQCDRTYKQLRRPNNVDPRTGPFPFKPDPLPPLSDAPFDHRLAHAMDRYNVWQNLLPQERVSSACTLRSRQHLNSYAARKFDYGLIRS